jgi:hypothetical protein
MLWATVQRLTREQLCMGILGCMNSLVAEVIFLLHTTPVGTSHDAMHRDVYIAHILLRLSLASCLLLRSFRPGLCKIKVVSSLITGDGRCTVLGEFNGRENAKEI